MLVALLVLIPLAAALVAWTAGRWSKHAPARVSAASLVAVLGIALLAWTSGGHEVSWPWIPSFGVSLHLALDGLSLVMVLLTAAVGLVAVAVSRPSGFFHANLMLTLTGVIGVFLARDLLVFYVMWELMVVPMAVLIAVWGHGARGRAALTFALFTQAGALLMLVAILAAAFIHQHHTGTLTFGLNALMAAPPTGPAALWILLGFLAAFAVKLPAVPLHSWLPLAHTQAPTAGSVILAGLLLKTGAYGLIRIAIPLFPTAVDLVTPAALALGVAGVLYGAAMAFAQTDLKRLIAYTSVSHLGFVLVGAFAGSPMARTGAVMVMICHALSTGGLFVLADVVARRTGTRDLRQLGGLREVMPGAAVCGTVLAMASVGLPGLGNFVGEFLVLAGTFQTHPEAAVLATLGLVLSAAYALRFMREVFHGPLEGAPRGEDLTWRERAVLGGVLAALVVLGLFPSPVLTLIGGTWP